MSDFKLEKAERRIAELEVQVARLEAQVRQLRDQRRAALEAFNVIECCCDD